MLPVTDAVILAQTVDATLLVVAAGQTRGKNLRRATEALSLVQATIVGVVLNEVTKSTGYGYGYGKKYGYGEYLTTGAAANGNGAGAQAAANGNGAGAQAAANGNGAGAQAAANGNGAGAQAAANGNGAQPVGVPELPTAARVPRSPAHRRSRTR